MVLLQILIDVAVFLKSCGTENIVVQCFFFLFLFLFIHFFKSFKALVHLSFYLSRFMSIERIMCWI